MSQVATQVNGRSTSSMNEELLVSMRRVAVASERTAAAAEKTAVRVWAIECMLACPLIIAVVLGFLVYAASLR